MFYTFLWMINETAQNVTYENFVTIQRIQDSILKAYNLDRSLSDREKRALYEIATIVRNDMRAKLSLDRS